MIRQWLYHCFILLFVITFAWCFDPYEEDFMNDQQTFPPDRAIAKPEIIKQLKGGSVTLRCAVDDCTHHRRHFKWEFKFCKSNFKNSPCEKYYDTAFIQNSAYSSEWRKVPAKHSRSSMCFYDQKISNLTVENSGLYRCIVNNKTLQIYQVEVVETEKVVDASPKILEMIPGNVTIAINSQLIIQCKVYSPMEPLIVWFKQCDGSKDDVVVYNGNYYTKINTSVDTNPVQKEENVYLSKLNIHKVNLLDNGVYACVGVNGNSFNVEIVTVKVQGFQNWEPHTSLSLLFLIPLAFALVPITVWLCYYKNKRKERDRTKVLQQKKLINVHNTCRVNI